jgi:Flp pilus assembly protein TadB
MEQQLPEEEPGRRPGARYPLSRLLIVVVLGFVASSVLQLLFPGLGVISRLSILVIVAALISLAVTFGQQRSRRR